MIMISTFCSSGGSCSFRKPAVACGWADSFRKAAVAGGSKIFSPGDIVGRMCAGTGSAGRQLVTCHLVQTKAVFHPLFPTQPRS